MSSKRLLISGVGALVAAAIAGGIAYATIPGPDNVYRACMLKSLGTIRLIDKSLPSSNLMSHCTDKETEISWNQAGQPGPQGAKGEPGAPGTNGANGTDGKDGVSVTTASEPAAANCAEGGSKFTAANGVTYACNGARGADGEDGEDGAQGPPGAAGPPGGLAGYEIVTASGEAPNGSTVTVECPSGKKAVGGGWLTPGGVFVGNWFNASYPVTTDQGGGWAFHLAVVGANSNIPYTFYAVCATAA